ncbi:Asp23/Gls24 family envelope stress response protein [Christensenella sp. MSJ-20]|nr:MAG: Asp23/Gls24 family envelope stress response protein [Bacillota bacterium]QWT56219.1 Asp23/Gls24 family envelope stress response protein [Christensenella sp. MSJ-20]
MEFAIQEEQSGKVTFNTDVIATIAGLATVEVPGVAGMSGGIVSGMAELLGRRNLTKGVKVAINEQECEVDLNIVVTYGVKIPEVTAKIQGDVKSSIETMTGLTVKSVDIHVQGVDLEKKKEDQSVEGDSVQIPVQ